MAVMTMAAQTDMDPEAMREAAASFPDELIEGQMITDELEPGTEDGIAIFITWKVTTGDDVGSLSQSMLAIRHTTHEGVQLGAAKATGDDHRYANILSQGLQHLLTEMLEVADRLNAGFVADAITGGSSRASKLAQSKMRC